MLLLPGINVGYSAATGLRLGWYELLKFANMAGENEEVGGAVGD
jgi:hypothetical protein